MTPEQRARELALLGVIRSYDSAKHPHAPKGSHIGGQFVSKILQAISGKRPESKAPSSVGKVKAALPAPKPRGAAPGLEIRTALARAKTTRDVGQAAKAEAHRISGRHIPFDFAGSDPAIAREHAEGVLRGLEHFPKARLSAVGVADLSTARRGSDGPSRAWARTQQLDDGSSRIDFDLAYSSSAGVTGYREELAQSGERRRMGRGHTTGTPMGTALHEFGHVVTGVDRHGANGRAADLVDSFVEHDHRYEPDRDPHVDGARRRSIVGLEVSRYATESHAELTAEAVADVMEHGEGASDLSRMIMDVIEHEAGR